MIPGGGDLRFDRMPPLWVPLRAFLVAPFLGAGGGVLLAVVGDAALASRWTGSLLAAAHLVTLGFVTLVMIGAVVQVLPVVTGVPVPGTGWVAPTAQFGVGAGAVAMAWGLAGRAAAPAGAGAVLLAGGLGVFVVAALRAAWRARRNPTGRAMGLSVLSLVAVAGLGIVLLSGHAGWMPLRRDLTDVHLAWALAGWVGLLVVGVSFQVVPMFQVTPQYPRAVQEVLPAVAFAALVAWTVGRLGRWPVVGGVGVTVLAAALGGYAVVTLRLQARRRRKLRDVTSDAWRLGMASLVLAGLVAVVGAAGVVDVTRPRVALGLGVLLVVGFAVTVIEGMLYKIVPFLSWLHLQNLLTRRGTVGKVKVRNMRQLLPGPGPRRQFVAHLAAVGLLFLAVALGGAWVRLAGAALTVDLGWLGVELLGVVLRYREDRTRVVAVD